MPDSAALILPEGTIRSHFWAECAAAQACGSPPGNGWDCHRTWEALALGCVPLILRHSLGGIFDDVFKGLPVAFVDGDGTKQDWATALHPTTLAIAVADAWAGAAPDWKERLTTNFWWNKIVAESEKLHGGARRNASSRHTGFDEQSE